MAATLLPLKLKIIIIQRNYNIGTQSRQNGWPDLDEMAHS